METLKRWLYISVGAQCHRHLSRLPCTRELRATDAGLDSNRVTNLVSTDIDRNEFVRYTKLKLGLGMK